MITQFEKAIAIAKAYHLGQEYGDGMNYFTAHISEVITIASLELMKKEFADLYDTETKEAIVIAAVLHDTFEDTTYTFDQCIADFGYFVAEMVKACTDDDTFVTRKERKADVYKRLKAFGSEAIFVKLCDRLANVKAAGKLDMYRKEHADFKAVCYLPEHATLWAAIEKELEKEMA